MKNIHIRGWYGHQNLGDESYKLTFPLLFGDSYRLNFSDSYSLQDPHDVVCLGGGDIFSTEFTKPLLEHDKKCIAVSITLPDAPCEQSLNKMSLIAVRDRASYNLIKDRKNAYYCYCPDIAFLLSGNAYNGKEILKSLFDAEKRDLYENVIVVVVNSHLLAKPSDIVRKHIAFDNLCFKLSEAFDNTNASFIFLPFSTHMPWDDRVSNGIVASRCKFWKKNLVVYDRLGVQDTIDIMSASNGVISTRLHSSIFSCVANVPFIDITHNHKNHNLLKDLELQDMSISYDQVSFEKLNQKLTELIKEPMYMIEKLKQVTLNQKKEIGFFSEILRSL